MSSSLSPRPRRLVRGLLALALPAAGLAAVALPAAPADAAPTCETGYSQSPYSAQDCIKTLTSTGGVVLFEAPVGVSTFKVSLHGGAGGRYNLVEGGHGGIVEGTLTATAGTAYAAAVGGLGSGTDRSERAYGGGGLGGSNNGRPGGGGTFLFQKKASETTYSLLAVAGGGGGAGGTSSGGAGTGLATGLDATGVGGGKGATASGGGGKGGTGASDGQGIAPYLVETSSLGLVSSLGGSGASSGIGGGGGGGGYYAGGGGADGLGGGGGSGYIAPSATGLAAQVADEPGGGKLIISYTPPSPLSAPQIYDAVRGDQSATLSWTKPSGADAATSYTVTSSGTPAKSCTVLGATTCTVAGLTNGTAYTFTVVATNGAGPSPASDASAPVTPMAPRSYDLSFFAGTGSSTATTPTSGAAATSTRVRRPYAAAVDAAGNTYIGGAGDNTIVKVSPEGVLTVIAGQVGEFPTEAPTSNPVATDVKLSATNGLVADAAGIVYGTDSSWGVVYKLTPKSDGTYSFTVISTAIRRPADVALDTEGNLYVSDSVGGVIVKLVPPISSGAELYTSQVIAGEGSSPAVRLNAPWGLAVDDGGTVFYVAEAFSSDSGAVRKLVPSGSGYTSSPVVTGLDTPHGLALDVAGNLYVASVTGSVVKSVPQTDGTYVSSIIAGGGSGSASKEGPARSSRLSGPSDVAVDAQGNLVVPEFTGDRVVKLTPVYLTAPGAPTGVSASAGDGKVTVSWSAPTSDGGSAITGYTVTSSGSPAKTCTVSPVPASGGLSCDVTGLTNGSSYTFTVKATTAIGEGPASDTMVSGVTPKAAQSVSFTSSPPTAAAVDGPSYTATASGTAGGGAISFSRGPGTTNSACTVSGSMVSFAHVGTCEVVATQAATEGYSAGTASQSFTVGKGTWVVSISSSAPTNAVVDGATYAATAQVSPSSDVAVDWSAVGSPAGACTVTSAGVVSFAKAGSCVLKAAVAATSDYEAASATQNVAVGRGTSAVTFASQAPDNAVVGGTTYTPTFSDGASTADPVLSSTTTTVCTVASGVVSFIGAGTCGLTVDQAADEDYLSSSATQSLSVGKGTRTGVSFSTTASEAVVGGSYSPVLTAVPAPAASDVTFSIESASPAGACAVDEANKVVFVHMGSCVVKGTAAATADYMAASVTQPVTVGKGSQVLTFTTAPSAPTVGGTYTPHTTMGASGQPVVIAVGEATTGGACEVSEAGVVSFTAVGTCQLVATQAGSTDYSAAVPVTQTFAVAQPGVTPVTPTTSPSASPTSQPTLPVVTATVSVDPSTGSATGSAAEVPQVGVPVRVTATVPDVPGAAVAYQWQVVKADGTIIDIPGAVDATYVPTGEYAGLALQVLVTTTAPGYTPSTQIVRFARSSQITPGVIEAVKVKTRTQGRHRHPVVGRVIRAKVSTAWLARLPAGAVVSYRWMAKGKTVGATKTLKIRKRSLGKRLRLVVTVSAPGYDTATFRAKRTLTVVKKVKPKR